MLRVRGICRFAAVCAFLSILCAADEPQFRTIDRKVVESRLNQFAGENLERELTLRQMFVLAGCDGKNLKEVAVPNSDLPNIVCVLPGASPDMVIVGAHYDHTPGSLGIVDNWTGASLLPTLYESLKSQPRRLTYVFVGFTDEEKGELGSKGYAASMEKKSLPMVKAMVNMESLGLGATKVWASHSDKTLVDALYQVGKANQSQVQAVEEVESSDSEAFRKRKIPVITIHSLTKQAWDTKQIHSNRDQMSAVSPDDFYRSYQLAAAYLASLDDRLSAPVAVNKGK